MAKQIIMNLAVSQRIERPEGNVYDRSSCAPLTYIYGIAEDSESKDLQINHLIIVSDQDGILFAGDRSKFVRDDEDDPDDDGSIYETVEKHVRIKEVFGDEKGYHIADMIENLLSEFDSHFSISNFDLDMDYVVGDFELVGNGLYSVFISRFISVNDGPPLDLSDPLTFHEQVAPELDMDDHWQLDVTVLIR